MKFTPVQDIKAATAGVGTITFEGGNAYSVEKYPNVPGLETKVKNWHANGLCAIEGQDDVALREPIKDVGVDPATSQVT